MDCNHFKRELDLSHSPALLSGDLRAHAAQCRVCAAHWQKHLSLHRLLHELEVVAPPADFDAQLQFRLRSHESSSRRSSVFDAPPTFAKLTASCASLLLIACALYIGLNTNFEKEGAKQITTVQDQQIEKFGNPNPRNLNPRKHSPVEDATVNSLSVAALPVNSPPHLKAGYKSHVGAISPSVKTVAARRHRPTSKPPMQVMASVNGNSVIRENIAAEARVVKLPLPTNQERMEVTMRDSQGEKEALILDAVSFGGQPLVRVAKNRTASADAQQGVW